MQELNALLVQVDLFWQFHFGIRWGLGIPLSHEDLRLGLSLKIDRPQEIRDERIICLGI